MTSRIVAATAPEVDKRKLAIVHPLDQDRLILRPSVVDPRVGDHDRRIGILASSGNFQRSQLHSLLHMHRASGDMDHDRRKQVSARDAEPQ
jgi:hypothetical protein